ncbi:MAG: hypothetical protein K2G45_07520 [Lachnospiraceae bacterium]|nr:hypothetical protein [Lachnospiraceae bacterium]
MIPVPHTYSEWVYVLTIFKNKSNDVDALSAMRTGTIEWQSGVAERFSQKLIDAVNERMNVASDKFQLEMSRAGGQEGAIVQAILALRKEMAFLAQAINLPALPEKERKYYLNLVVQQADVMQKSLEDSARNDRSGKLSSIIRNHKVNFLEEKY